MALPVQPKETHTGTVILVWPKQHVHSRENERIVRNGWAVGWRQTLDAIDVIVVADLVPFRGSHVQERSNSVSLEEQKQRELDALRRRIRNVSSSDDTLDVVLHLETPHSSAQPTMENTIARSPRGFPIWSRSIQSCQVVLYHCHSCRVRNIHDALCTPSPLLHYIWTRTTRAGTVWNASHETILPAESTKSKHTVARDDSTFVGAAAWMVQQSLVARHCQQVQRRSIVTLIRAALQQRRPPNVTPDTLGSLFVSALDAVAGVALGGLVVSWRPTEDYWTWHYPLLSASLQWLQSNPLGIKLNQPLLEHVGREIQRGWNVHELVVRSISTTLAHGSTRLPTSGMACMWIVIVILSVTLGGSGLVVVALDGIRLATWHVSAVASVTRHVYAWVQLDLWAALWRLVRGQKRNVVRARTDSMDYDAMQLLLGTILLVVVLCLWTTMCVYHAVFTMLYLAIVLVTMCPCVILYHVWQHMPWVRLWWRFHHPHEFPRDVCLVNVGDHDVASSTRIDVTELEVTSCTYTSILVRAFRKPVHVMVGWLAAYVTGLLDGSRPSTTLVDAILPTR